MDKRVVAIANNKILLTRVDAILTATGFKPVELLSNTTLNGKRLDVALKDISLILLDLETSEIEGVEVIKKIRSFKNKVELPILVFSSNNDVANLSRAIHAGCNDVILKPFEDVTLSNKLIKSVFVAEKDIRVVTSDKNESVLDPFKINMDILPPDTKLKWSDDFKVGHEQIDQEHQLIVEKYATLYDLMKEGKGHDYYGQLLLFLKDYIEFHFSNEEKIQQEVGYLGQLRHKKLHEAFKAEIAKIIEKQQDSEITNAELIRFNLFLKNWLIYHILIEDRAMVENLKHS